jgi:hypothetical protein
MRDQTDHEQNAEQDLFFPFFAYIREDKLLEKERNEKKKEISNPKKFSNNNNNSNVPLKHDLIIQFYNQSWRHSFFLLVFFFEVFFLFSGSRFLLLFEFHDDDDDDVALNLTQPSAQSPEFASK